MAKQARKQADSDKFVRNTAANKLRRSQRMAKQLAKNKANPDAGKIYKMCKLANRFNRLQRRVADVGADRSPAMRERMKAIETELTGTRFFKKLNF
jgi:hypothetical protein